MEIVKKKFGELCEVKIRIFGGETVTLGSLKERKNRIVVYEVEKEFEDLKGEYENTTALEKKIQDKKEKWYDEEKEWYSDRLKRKVIIGKCIYCKTFHEDKDPNIISGRYEGAENTPSVIFMGGCSNHNCRSRKSPQLNYAQGVLYTSNGGSLSVCHTVGKWKFL